VLDSDNRLHREEPANRESVRRFVNRSRALHERASSRHGRDGFEVSGQNPAMVAAGVRTIIGEEITMTDVQKPLDFAYKHGVIAKQYDANAMLSQLGRRWM
jgi:hypothetical protein